jgi:hypothetical protein
MSLTYLASPYSNPSPLIRESRFRQACEVAARLMDRGENVFSPIAHSHPIDLHFTAPRSGDFWLKQDIEILRHASVLKVLMLEGWMESAGIKREVSVARANGIPVEYIDP